MKIIAKLILTLLFIPVFLLFILAVNLRSQILAPSFWEKTFDINNTYSKLSISISKNLESQAEAEGGRAGDVKIFTDLASPENLKDAIDKNIYNILQYANGKSKEIIVYVPAGKIPGALLSKNLNPINEQMKLTDLLKEFNVTGVSPTQIQMISHAGIYSWVFFAATLFLSVLFLYLLSLLTDSGKRYAALSLTLILSGLAAFFVNFSGTAIRNNWANNPSDSKNLGDSLIRIVVPPVFKEILTIWFLFAAVAVIAGFVLFFIKKPYNTTSKPK